MKLFTEPGLAILLFRRLKAFRERSLILLLTTVISMLFLLAAPFQSEALGAGNVITCRYLEIVVTRWADLSWLQMAEIVVSNPEGLSLPVAQGTCLTTTFQGHGVERLWDESYRLNDEFVVQNPGGDVTIILDLGVDRQVSGLRVFNDGDLGAVDLYVKARAQSDARYFSVGSFTGLSHESSKVVENNLLFDSQVYINEIYAGTDSWIELYNPGSMDHSLHGWHLTTNGSTIELEMLSIPRGGFLVLLEGWGSSTASRFFLTRRFEWTNSESGFCGLNNPSGQGVDFVRWGFEASLPDAPDVFTGTNPGKAKPPRSLGRRPDGHDTNDGADFGSCFATPGKGNTGLFRISGTVQDNLAFPLSEVTLYIDGAASGVTNSQGVFTIVDLPGGTVTISARKREYVFSPPGAVLQLSSDITNVSFMGAIDTGFYNLSGYVKDSRNDPVSELRISVSGGLQTQTSASGYYSFAGLQRGMYKILPDGTSHNFDPPFRVVELAGDMASQNFIESAVAAPHSLSGRVLTSQGMGIQDVRMRCNGTDTFTDIDGNFLIENLPVGRVVLVPVKSGMEFTPQSLAIDLPSAGNVDFMGVPGAIFALEAKVLDDAGLPLGNAAVHLLAEGRVLAEEISSGDGIAVFPGLPPASYELTASFPGHQSQPLKHLVTITDANQSVQFTLSLDRERYRLAGMVRSADGLPVMGVQITAGAGLVTSTGADGYFEFSFLQRGSYTVTALRDGMRITPSEIVVELHADSANLAFQALARTDLTLSGKVLDLFGVPIGGVTLDIGNGQKVQTDPNGRYAMTGLTAGFYTLTALKSGYVFSPYAMDLDLSRDQMDLDFTGDYQLFYPVTAKTRYLKVILKSFHHSDYLQMNEVKFRGNTPGSSMVRDLGPVSAWASVNAYPGYGPEKLIDGNERFNGDFACRHLGGPVEIVFDLGQVFLIDRIHIVNDGQYGAASGDILVGDGTDQWHFIGETGLLAVTERLPRANRITFSAAPILISEVGSMGPGFVELINTGWTRVSLRDYRIVAGAADVTLGEIFVGPGGRVCLTGGTAIQAFTSLGQTLAFNPAGDKVVLMNSKGLCDDFIRWGSCWDSPPSGIVFTGANPPAPTVSKSLNRINETQDTDSGSDWFSASNTPGHPQGTLWSISGMVNDTTGNPLAGIKVTAVGLDAMVFETVTTASGTFSITGLPSSRYSLVPTLDNYSFVPVSANIDLFRDSSGNLFRGEQTSRPFFIQGKIVDNLGSPLAGAAVGISTVTFVSGADGTWKSQPLFTAGSFAITPRMSGYQFQPASSVITVTAANILQGGSVEVSFVATPLSTDVAVSGRLLLNGASFYGVKVEARPQGNFVYSDVDGRYTLTVPSGSTTEILPSRLGYFFTPGSRSLKTASDPVVNADFIGERSYSVGGWVHDAAGNGLKGASVRFHDGVTVPTGKDGSFIRSDLPAGGVTVEPVLPGWSISPSITSFQLPPNSTVLSFTATRIESRYNVSGRLMMADTGSGVSDVLMSAKSSDGQLLSQTYTDQQGNYSLISLSAGTVIVTPAFQGYEFTPGGQSLNVSANLTGIDFTVARLCYVSGRVQTSQGVPVSLVRVTLGGGPSPELISETTNHGNFFIGYARQGNYILRAERSGFTMNPSSMNMSLSSSVSDLIFIANPSQAGDDIFVDSILGDDFAYATSDKPIKSLQKALDMAAERGGSVKVRLSPGLYRGSFVIPYGVTLQGAGPGSTILDSSGTSFGVQGPQRGELRGLTIRGSGGNPLSTGVLCTNSETRLVNCLITGSGSGIRIVNSVVEITNCTIAGNSFHGIVIENSPTGSIDSTLCQDISVVSGVSCPVNYSALFSEYANNPPAGTGNILINESFSQFPVPWHPAAGSSCVNSGNPSAQQKDMDGSVCDIGAYGGPGPITFPAVFAAAQSSGSVSSHIGYSAALSSDGIISVTNGYSCSIEQNPLVRVSIDLGQTHRISRIRISMPGGMAARSVMVSLGSDEGSAVEWGWAALTPSGKLIETIEVSGEPVPARWVALGFSDFIDQIDFMVSEIECCGTDAAGDTALGTGPLDYSVLSNIQPYPGFGFSRLADGLKNYNNDFAVLNHNSPVTLTLMFPGNETLTAVSFWNDGLYGASKVNIEALNSSGAWATVQTRSGCVMQDGSAGLNEFALAEIRADGLRLTFDGFGDSSWFQLNEISVQGFSSQVSRQLAINSITCDAGSFPGYGPERLHDGTIQLNSDFALRNPPFRVRLTVDLGQIGSFDRIRHTNDGPFGAGSVTVFTRQTLDGSETVVGTYQLSSSQWEPVTDTFDIGVRQAGYVIFEYASFMDPVWFQLNEIQIISTVSAVP
ncbi:MAG: hypothetical protein CVV64_01540 [Candidatus Wallbacteria bacterium HGW-Wallbacteria-1]|jgi:hypothetical protein|uniref:Right handed beta helix domain-containing protein n=1 Tax=Candidatus Wallbacteria bacterium HGW-Wallbacteria-1 TaxID=2013854 RepID=A0A2N1PUZ0_9BACT|nr:MAG: hypothetical protein CVV64_01540 [Candidatus Wallbacteria bacterium HGW-Wallbacteria-1]